MNKSEHFGFNLPSSENPEEIADVNVISQNFILADSVIKNLSDTINKNTFVVDSNLSPTSKNPVENKVVSENVSPIRIKKTGNPIAIEDSSFIEHEIKANTRIPFANAEAFLGLGTSLPEEKTVLVVSSVDSGEEIGSIAINIYFEGGWQLQDGSFSEPHPPIPKVGDKIVYNPDDGSLALIYDVTKYGKNLLSFENFVYETSTSKIEWADGLFRLAQKSTATSSNVISLTQTANYYSGVPVFPAGTYFFTADPVETLAGRKVNPILRCDFTDGSGECTIEANKPVTASKPFEIKAVITSSIDREKGYVYESRWQLECGSVGTDWEFFKKGETYTADENGNVNGIMANGETMTLIADTDATISAKYTADTKKYIDKKFAELQALYLGV